MIATEDDVARASDIDHRFHHGIAAATGNRYIIELSTRFSRIRARLPFLFFRYGLYQPMTDQHTIDLSCLREGAAEEAARLTATHVQLTRSREEHTRHQMTLLFRSDAHHHAAWYNRTTSGISGTSGLFAGLPDARASDAILSTAASKRARSTPRQSRNRGTPRRIF